MLEWTQERASETPEAYGFARAMYNPSLPITVSKDGVAFFNHDAFLGGFAPDVNMADREFMFAEQVPLAVSVFSLPITNPAW